MTLRTIRFSSVLETSATSAYLARIVFTGLFSIVCEIVIVENSQENTCRNYKWLPKVPYLTYGTEIREMYRSTRYIGHAVQCIDYKEAQLNRHSSPWKVDIYIDSHCSNVYISLVTVFRKERLIIPLWRNVIKDAMVWRWTLCVKIIVWDIFKCHVKYNGSDVDSTSFTTSLVVTFDVCSALGKNIQIKLCLGSRIPSNNEANVKFIV